MSGERAIEVRAGHATHVGNIRSRNEDSVLADDALFVVADGMGGHEAGDRASQIAVNQLGSAPFGARIHRNHILDRVRAGHAEIRLAAGGPERFMGTTISGIAILGDPVAEVLVFNVGDSRVYRLRSGHLVQLTRDHSVVQELVDAGALAADQADTHPERHIITRSLGSEAPLQIDWWTEEPQVGDRYLIASDGLTNELPIDELTEIVGSGLAPQATVDELIRRTLIGTAPDNLSAVVVEVLTVPHPSAAFVDDNPLNAETAPTDRSIDAPVAAAHAAQLDPTTVETDPSGGQNP